MGTTTTARINDAKSFLVTLSDKEKQDHVSQESKNFDSFSKGKKRFQFLVTLCGE